MPASKQQLLERVERSIRDAGWTVERTSALGGHPAHYALTRVGQQRDITVYIWNISPGGQNRPADERRIQITGVSSFAQSTEPALTLILGWSDAEQVFAAWDPAHHKDVLGASPSLQINRQTLESAQTQGIASYRKATGELAIAFVPEFIGVYINESRELHELGKAVTEATVLDQVAADPTAVTDEAIDQSVAAKPRAYALRVTKTALRDIRFRKNVLAAYGHQCAMCALQLQLVEAAHIVPVGHPSGTDETSNGVALCALHHSAYDAGLIAFDEHYNVLISDAKFAELDAMQRGGGAKGFKEGLRQTLHLPQASGVRPKPDYVKKANALRGW